LYEDVRAREHCKYRQVRQVAPDDFNRHGGLIRRFPNRGSSNVQAVGKKEKKAGKQNKTERNKKEGRGKKKQNKKKKKKGREQRYPANVCRWNNLTGANWIKVPFHPICPGKRSNCSM